MRFLRTAGWLAALAVLLMACSSSPRPADDELPTGHPPAEDTGEPEPDPRHNPPDVPDPPGGSATPPAKAPKPATVTVEQGAAEQWRPVTVLESHAPPGPVTIRLSFSKPVRQDEVEQALREGQLAPVRGIMQWLDVQTLVWQIAALPPRLDFLLGSAHDADGLPLPGGIPSLRVGEPPALVTLDLATGEETAVVPLPPDIQSAALSEGGTHLNLAVWRPGTNQWDWQPAQTAVDLATGNLQSGWVEGVQPRFSVGLEQWAFNPARTVVAGIRGSDLMIMDTGGGRQQVVEGFVTRTPGSLGAQQPPSLAWAPAGDRVAALSHKTGGLSDLVALALPAGPASVLLADLPVPAAGTQLAWSPDGRYVLAGRLLIDLEQGEFRPLAGVDDQARGAWEPGGTRVVLDGGDWGPVLVADPATGAQQDLGHGLAAGWAGTGRLYLVRWPASDTRYVPPGIVTPQ